MITRLLCRHLFGLPRTSRNLSLVRSRLTDYSQFAAMILSFGAGVALMYGITVLVFGWPQ
jgi:hypothetical protein